MNIISRLTFKSIFDSKLRNRTESLSLIQEIDLNINLNLVLFTNELIRFLS